MSSKQATRPIRKGSHWTNGEEELIVTEANSRSVYYKTLTGGIGFASIWYFRENFAPGRLPRK